MSTLLLGKQLGGALAEVIEAVMPEGVEHTTAVYQDGVMEK